MEPGDHICVNRRYGPLRYVHHGIYISSKEVIHFTGKPFGDNRDSAICSTTLDEFAPGGWIGVIPYEDCFHFGSVEVIERARDQIGRHEYDVRNWNCEHFATWCVTDVAVCHQAGQPISEFIDFLNWEYTDFWNWG